jgi:hypothetical protein
VCSCRHPNDRHVNRCAFRNCRRFVTEADYCAKHENVRSILDFRYRWIAEQLWEESVERPADPTGDTFESKPFFDGTLWITQP